MGAVFSRRSWRWGGRDKVTVHERSSTCRMQSRIWVLCDHSSIQLMAQRPEKYRSTHPSSASRVAGASACAMVIFPEPSTSMVSHQAAAQPGTVTLLECHGSDDEPTRYAGTAHAFRSVPGIECPVSPRLRAVARSSAFGERPDPLRPVTFLVFASQYRLRPQETLHGQLRLRRGAAPQELQAHQKASPPMPHE